MGDRRKQTLRVQFDGKPKLEFHGAQITSDAGLLAFRELDETFRLTETGSTVLSDCRRGKNTHHMTLALLRQGVYGRLASYEDVKDAKQLHVAAAMRQVVDSRVTNRQFASTSQMNRSGIPNITQASILAYKNYYGYHLAFDIEAESQYHHRHGSSRCMSVR